jgi:hypothetical protein
MKVLEPVELVAVKSYYASGIVLVIIYFGGNFYAVVSDAGAEQPLLDSKFPDVSPVMCCIYTYICLDICAYIPLSPHFVLFCELT